MIINTEIIMKWNSSNIKYYENLGYKYTNIGDDFLINIKHLNKNSHYKVFVACDICEKIISKEYKSYNMCLNNNNFYACSECRFKKTEITNKKRYGVRNVFQIEEIKNENTERCRKNSQERLEKRTKTNLIKYGVENPFQIEEVKELIKQKTYETKIKNGLFIDNSKITGFKLYKKQVTKFTNQVKKELFNNWNGYDYYDGEYIKENFKYKHTNPIYPTIDHKNSIRYGFDNNISPIEIASLNNLCITKRKINTSKYIKTEIEYKNKKGN